MPLYERLLEEQVWRSLTIAFPLPEEVTYDLRPTEKAAWRRLYPHGPQAYAKTGDLFILLGDMRVALICSFGLYQEAVRLYEEWQSEQVEKGPPPPDLELSGRIRWLFEGMAGTNRANSASRYFLDDVFLRMHAYMEHAYVLAGYLINQPGASKKKMTNSEFIRSNPAWAVHPLKRSLDKLRGARGYKKCVEGYRNDWTHRENPADLEFVPDEFLMEAMRLYGPFFELHVSLDRAVLESVRTVLSSQESLDVEEHMRRNERLISALRAGR